MKYIVPLFILAISIAAKANETAHGAEGSGEIPVRQIFYQAINVLIIFVGLIYFLKDGVKKFFQDKKAVFMDAAKKAEAARKTAEQEHLQIQIRLSKLESSADESVSRARAEAADMKKQLIADAEALSNRIREEAERTAQLEVEKAKIHLREALIKESIAAAKTQLTSKVSSEDQRRLQSDFVNHLEAVEK